MISPFSKKAPLSGPHTSTANPLVRLWLVQVIAKQFVTALTVGHGPFNSRACGLFAKAPAWKDLLAEYFLYWIFLFPPPNNGCARDAQIPRPLSNGHRLFCVGQNNIVSPIVILFGSLCPFTIIRRIWSFVIDSFDGVFRRTLSHVREKVFEHLPPLAYRNASRAVISVFFDAWVGAPSQHTSPDFIGFVFGHSVNALYQGENSIDAGAAYGI